MKYALVKGSAAKCHRLAHNLLNANPQPPSPSLQALFAAGRDVDAIALETILKTNHTMAATPSSHSALKSQDLQLFTKTGSGTLSYPASKVSKNSIKPSCFNSESTLGVTSISLSASSQGEPVVNEPSLTIIENSSLMMCSLRKKYSKIASSMI